MKHSQKESGRGSRVLFLCLEHRNLVAFHTERGMKVIMWKRIKQGLAGMLGLIMLVSAMPTSVIAYAEDTPGNEGTECYGALLSAEEIEAQTRAALAEDGLEWGGVGVTHPTVAAQSMGEWLPASVAKGSQSAEDAAAAEIQTVVEHFFGGSAFSYSADTQTAVLYSDGKLTYGHWGTDKFRCTGLDGSGSTTTFCLEPAKGTPTTGSTAVYTAYKLDVNSEWDNWIRSILYYGYDGPGYNDPNYGLKKSMEDGSDNNAAYVTTHILLSYAFEYHKWVKNGRQGTFVKADAGTWTGITDTNEINGYITKGDALWDCMGTVPYNFFGFTFNDGQTTQTMAYGWTEPAGWLYLNKASANPSLTNNNPNYSLSGATYYIYKAASSDADYLDKHYKTDENGKAWAVDSSGNWIYTYKDDGTKEYQDWIVLSPGDYYVQEWDTPNGYEWDSKFYKVTITSGQGTYVNYDSNTGAAYVYDKPKNDPLNVTIYKQDADGKAVSNTGNTTLAGAEYTAYYFTDTTITNAAAGSLDLSTAFKHWTFKTIYNASTGKYVARLDDEHWVAGDALFKDENNNTTFPMGTYVISETKAPTGYQIAGNTFTCNGVTTTNNRMVVHITEDGNGDINVDCGNTIIQSEKEIRGGVEIVKKDANTRTAVPQGDATLAGAEYTIVNNSGAPITIGSTTYANGQAIQKLTTDANGHAGTARKVLPYGDYYIYETKAPTGYTLDSTHYPFSIRNEDDYVSLTTQVTDPVIRGGIKIQKRDNDLRTNTPQGAATLSGAVYKITTTAAKPVVVNGTAYSKGQVVARITTDAGGNATTANNLLPYGSYTIQEETPSTGYQLNPEVVSFQITTSGQMVALTTGQMTEVIARGGVSLVKIDKETMQPVAQGDASLEGAKYAIVTENANPVVVSGVTYQNGATVKTLTTDAHGRASTGNNVLPYGNYYAVETEPSEGYLLNDTKIHFTVRENGKMVAIGNETTEQVKKQSFQLIKISSNGTNTEAATIESAEFTVKLRSDIIANGWDMAKVYDVLTTDKTGYAKSVELPYGTYTVRETKVPDDMTAVEDFTVVIPEDSRTPQVWRVFNDTPYEAYVKIVKKDSVSGKTILLPGVTFKLYDIANDEYVTQKLGRDRIDTFRTDADGITETPLKIASGDYELREFTAPDGYLINTDGVRFTIGSSSPVRVELDEDGEPVVVVEIEDQPVTGKVEIYKHGEVLTEANEIPTDPLTVSVIANLFRHSTEFVYEDHPLAGCTFTVVAEEDIYTPDHQVDENGDRTLAVYNGVTLRKGAVAATATSGANGRTEVADLPLGAYYVEEISVCDGYLRSHIIDHFVLEYAGDSVAVVSSDSDYENTRVKAALNLVKTGAKTNAPVSGAEYGLFCREDITAFDGTVLLSAGSLIETEKTDANGEISFTADLPLMPYYVKELVSPAGYVKNETVYDVDLTYVDDETPVILATVTAEDEEIILSISKKDATTGEELPGAELTLFTVDGEVYDTWTSGEEPHILVCIPKGTYTLHEDLAPLGYATASDVVIEVTETAELQKAVMEDEIIKLSISKKDATNGEELPGAKLTLFTADGEVYDAWTSGEEPHVLEKIPTGTYRLHEDLAPLGYATASDVIFEVKDTAELQKAEMQDEITKVSISKKHATTGEELPGAKLTLFTADGEVYDAWTSGEEPHVMEKIPTGTYRLHEDLAPLGYATASDITFEVKDTAELQKVEMQDEIIRVSISKQDATTGKELPGAELTLYDSDGKIYEKWTSGEKPHVIEKIPEGEYRLHEDLAPLGYATASDVTITIKDTGVLQEAVMKDEVIRVSISKKDATTGEELPGAELTLYTEDGVVYDAWTSGTEPHVIERIPEGEYRLHEDLAPLGYATASDVTITIKDTGMLQEAEILDEITRVEVYKQDLLTEEELSGAHLQIFAEDGSLYEEWDSTGEAHRMEKIPTGDYILRETVAPEGYELAEDVHFTVKDTGELQMVVMYDEKIPEVPKMGDTAPMRILGIIAGVTALTGSLSGIALGKRKKKGTENKKTKK